MGILEAGEGLAEEVAALGDGNSGGFWGIFSAASFIFSTSSCLEPEEISGSFGAFWLKTINRIAGTTIAPIPIAESIIFTFLFMFQLSVVNCQLLQPTY